MNAPFIEQQFIHFQEWLKRTGNTEGLKFQIAQFSWAKTTAGIYLNNSLYELTFHLDLSDITSYVKLLNAVIHECPIVIRVIVGPYDHFIPFLPQAFKAQYRSDFLM